MKCRYNKKAKHREKRTGHKTGETDWEKGHERLQNIKNSLRLGVIQPKKKLLLLYEKQRH